MQFCIPQKFGNFVSEPSEPTAFNSEFACTSIDQPDDNIIVLDFQTRERFKLTEEQSDFVRDLLNFGILLQHFKRICHEDIICNFCTRFSTDYNVPVKSVIFKCPRKPYYTPCVLIFARHMDKCRCCLN